MTRLRLSLVILCAAAWSGCVADTGFLPGVDSGGGQDGGPSDRGGPGDGGFDDRGRWDGGEFEDVPPVVPDAGPELCEPGQVRNCTCADGTAGVSVCGPDGEFGACECVVDICAPGDYFCELAFGMIGVWEGTAHTANDDIYLVRIEFRADGRYVAECRDTACVSAFYYGTADADPAQTYELVDLQANREGEAEIMIVFRPEQRPNIGELDRILLSGDHRQLEFRFIPSWNGSGFYVDYDLSRAQ